MGLKMKGVASSPEAGPSRRPDEVGCSTIGPVSTSNKGPSSKGYGPPSVISVNTREGPYFFISRPRPYYLPEEGLTVDGV